MSDLFHWFRDPAVQVLIRKVNEMSAATDALNAKVDQIQTAVSGIRSDIAAIKAGLPTEGGLTAAEVVALTAKVDAVLADATQLDSENT